MPRQKNIKPTSIYWLFDIRPETLAIWPGGKPFYCGKTIDTPEKRLQQHRRAARNKPYGGVAPHILECDVFIRVDVMEIVPAEQDWQARERFWIYSLRLLWPGCSANIADGGEGIPGWVPDAEHRAKLSASLRGIRKSPEHRAKIGDIHRGKKVSSSTRAKLRAAIGGRTLSAEHRAKIGASSKGRKFSAEHRAKMSAAMRGKKKTPEHVEKVAATRRGRKQTPEAIAKRVAANTGRKHSLESRAKMSAAAKSRHHS